jgi:VRR-NUC domain
MRRTKNRLEKCDFEILSLDGTYVKTPNARRVFVQDEDGTCTVEEYACRHLRRCGYRAVTFENEPMFTLFGALMWPVIQDKRDRRCATVGVINRSVVDTEIGGLTWTRLPRDFGKPEYFLRRVVAIEKHLAALSDRPERLKQVFESWLGASESLRHYLWGHRSEHIQVARQLLDLVPHEMIVTTLRYLIEDYWGRRSGWPDLMVSSETDFFLAEVKSAGDKLGTNQQRWVRDNQARLNFPFKLIEVRRLATVAA